MDGAHRGAVLTTVDIAGGACRPHLRKMPVNGSVAYKSSGLDAIITPAGERQEWLAAGLAMIAGFVDAYGTIKSQNENSEDEVET